MSEPTDNDRAAPLERLRDALSATGILAVVEWTQAMGASTTHPQLRSWHIPYLRLLHVAGIPDRVAAVSFAPVYVWGNAEWPVDDPDGLARRIAERYAQRQACQL